MNPTSVHRTCNRSAHEPATIVREAIQSLHELDPETSDHLGALAFVMMRVAQADGRFCSDERSRMEAILVEHAEIPLEQAVLVTEIACHRARLADCGSAYTISRRLRRTIEGPLRESIVRTLVAVAAADGSFAAVEAREIFQIAGEIGIDRDEVAVGLPTRF